MKKFIEGIKELRKKPYGNAVLFFGCYLIFFLGLALFSRLALNDRPKELEYEKGTSIVDSINLNAIAYTNYNFLYTIKLDSNSYIYEGNSNKTMESFAYNNEKYVYKNNKYYKNDIEVDNPYKYGEFLQLNNISELFKRSYLNSKTQYEDGRMTLNYLLSTNTIDKYLNNLDSDYDEMPNTLSVDINEVDGSITVKLGLNSYCKLNKICNDSMSVELQYSNFSK